MVGEKSIRRFQDTVWTYYRATGRHDLPWRQPTLKPQRAKGKTFDPYKILVSEVMLQQTQVPRVIEKYKEFLTAFPTVKRLARSSLVEVLKVWSGMGYNRRAKFLKQTAETLVARHKGEIPMDKASLLALPGIGEYTASAVCVFAYNEPCTLIETNIRSAFIHHFFSYPQKSALGPSLRDLRELSPETAFRTVLKVKDSELLPLIEKAAKGQDPREWHWALMDYGSHLKKLHKNPGRASASYVKQSKFEGSLRQMRGAILRALQKGPLSEPDLSHCAKLFRTRKLDLERMKEALSGLMRDGMVVKRKGKWGIV